MSTTSSYEEPTAWAGSSTSTGWPREVGGRVPGTHRFRFYNPQGAPRRYAINGDIWEYCARYGAPPACPATLWSQARRRHGRRNCDRHQPAASVIGWVSGTSGTSRSCQTWLLDSPVWLVNCWIFTPGLAERPGTSRTFPLDRERIL